MADHPKAEADHGKGHQCGEALEQGHRELRGPEQLEAGAGHQQNGQVRECEDREGHPGVTPGQPILGKTGMQHASAECYQENGQDAGMCPRAVRPAPARPAPQGALRYRTTRAKRPAPAE